MNSHEIEICNNISKALRLLNKAIKEWDSRDDVFYGTDIWKLMHYTESLEMLLKYNLQRKTNE